ncbi:MAG: serine/threonine-protein phosphatase [Candidatus Melainabacteria bacterium]|nr:serine/threonine-protein phosphatase [Candidatus Melainabacteria bacterium]
MKFTPSKVEYFGITDIGRVRTNNEDVWSQLPDKQFYILADGMGGHNAGEVAAAFAVETMCELMNSIPDGSEIETTCLFLREAVAKANGRVFNASRQHPPYSGMGTTLTCFVLEDNTLVYAHIGDSRLYRYRDQLEQLTEDHSLRHSLWTKETEGPPSLLLRNVITRAIGTQPSVLPDIGVIPVRSKDIYMLCSDGLSDYVSETKISSIFSSSLSLEEIGKKLVAAALEKGGNDNITLLLARIE